MNSALFSSTFLEVFEFAKIKEGEPDFYGGPNFTEPLNYLVLPSVYQFKKFSGPKFFVIH